MLSKWQLGVESRLSKIESDIKMIRTVPVPLINAGGVSTPPVAPPPIGNWPNEPAGLTLLTDYPMPAIVIPTGAGFPIGDGSGWGISQSAGPPILVTKETDLGAPFSAPNVVNFSYPTGFVSGVAPGNLYYTVGASTISEFYLGFWWKISNPWQHHSSGVSKVCQQFLTDGSDMILEMYKTITPPYLRIQTQFSGISINREPNVNQDEIILGTYNQMELHVKRSTGLIEWWMNNRLQGRYTGLSFPAFNFSEFQWAPVWGGTIDVKSEDDYCKMDHARISWAA